MDSFTNLLQQLNSPKCFKALLKIIDKANIPKLCNEVILLLRNIVRINNKDVNQFDGVQLVVEVVKKSLNYDYTSDEWLELAENFCSLIISIFDSFWLYQNNMVIKNVTFCNLIAETGKILLPVVNKIDCLRKSINTSGFTSIFQIICMDDLNFLVRKEIFLLFKPVIVKSDTRQRKTIMNHNEMFLSKMATMILNCGDYEMQEAIVEVLMRFSYTSKQKLNKLLVWFRNHPNVLTSTRLLDYKSFDVSCRKFLNSVNDSIISDDKVFTLHSIEAFANDIQLQKPNSEQYEELWVDFSMKTGIIHIVCDSGTNAWLRLFIESKNVKKSYVSSRFLKKNEEEIKAENILLELISPLEIELHFKENLIVTISLTFVESPKLDYLKTHFLNKWYHHTKKACKSNRLESMSKAFRESVHQRCKHQKKLFCGTSISSLSTIYSSSCSGRTKQTNRIKQGCCSFNSSRCNTSSFSSSTPKPICSQVLRSSNDIPGDKLIKPTGNYKCPLKFVDLQSTPSVSGGIFNQNLSYGSHLKETKSSLVKGISVDNDKKENGLFMEMIKESLRNKDSKDVNVKCKNESLKDSNWLKPNSLIITNSGSAKNSLLRRKISKNNIKLPNVKKDNSNNNTDYNSKVLNKIIDKDCSEESTFILSNYNNKQNKMYEKEGSIKNQNNNSYQSGTNYEQVQTNCAFNLDSKPESLNACYKLKKNSGCANERNEKSLLNTSLSYSNLDVPHLKVHHSKINISSVNSDQTTYDKTKQSEIENKEVGNNRPTFKLKPSILNFSTNNDRLLLTGQDSSNIQFSNFKTLSNKNKTSTSDNNDLDGIIYKSNGSDFNDFSISKKKYDCSLKDESSVKKVNESEQETELIKDPKLNNDNSINEDNNLSFSTSNISSLNENNRLKNIENQSIYSFNSNESKNESTIIPSFNKFTEQRLLDTENNSLSNQKKASNGAQDNFSSGKNTTISSLQSYHCNIPEKTYSSRPCKVKYSSSQEKIFDHLKRSTGNDKCEKSEKTNRKRKLFTPNSSLGEICSLQGESTSQPRFKIFQDIPASNRRNKRNKQNSQVENQQSIKRKKRNLSKPPVNIDNSDSNKKPNEAVINRRKSLRNIPLKKYKELSSGLSSDSEFSEKGLKKKARQIETSPHKLLGLPNEKFSINEKVTKFVNSMNDKKITTDVLRDEDLESELELCEASLEEIKSDISQLENIEPPLQLSTGEDGILSPSRSINSASDITIPVCLGGDKKELNNEVDFLLSVIKNLECLALGVKMKTTKINRQEKFVKTVEIFSSSITEEMNKKWEESRTSLQNMLASLDSLSESCKAFMMSFENRMKDIIESSITDYNKQDFNFLKSSDNVCKELKKMCIERHELLKKQQ